MSGSLQRAPVSVNFAVRSAAKQAFEQKCIPDEPFVGEAKFLCQVASMMARLQLHSPVGHTQSLRSQDDLPDHDISKPWPTPTPSDWEDIACRLFVTLEWASNKTKAPSCEDDSPLLREILLLLLTRLLLGYLQDDKIDMQKLFR